MVKRIIYRWILAVGVVCFAMSVVGCNLPVPTNEETEVEVVELLSNGDFSDGETGWSTNDSDGASWGGTGGDITVAYDSGAAVITNVIGGSSVSYESQFFTSANLVIGTGYTVSFDYSADQEVSFQFTIEHAEDYTNYLADTTGTDGKADLTATTSVQTYTHTFQMTEATDSEAKVVFLLSTATTGSLVTIDNVSIVEN